MRPLVASRDLMRTSKIAEERERCHPIATNAAAKYNVSHPADGFDPIQRPPSVAGIVIMPPVHLRYLR